MAETEKKTNYTLNIRNKIKTIKHFPVEVWGYLTFFYLLTVYLMAQTAIFISSSRFFPQTLTKALSPIAGRFYNRVISSSRHSDVTINRVNLIDLSIKNMRAKKSRTLVTVGGMAVGIGAIVLLVSLGYGLQQLVISRVARLEELKQANVAPQQGNKLKIDDSAITSFSNLTGVAEVLPQISLVGRVSYQNSNTDVAVYGVTSNYLKQSAIQPTVGDIFDNNELTVSVDSEKINLNTDPEALVAGVTDLQSGLVLAEEADDNLETIDVTEIDPSAQPTTDEPVMQVTLADSAVKQAVVNRSFLQVLGIDEAQAVGTVFETVFVVVGDLMDNPEQKVETIPTEYTIVGVTAEDDAPFFYVPFIDLRGIGITSYSQVKVVVDDQDGLTAVRRRIEAMGFLTNSVVDTVSQIDSLFSSLRVILAIVGLVAVAIASLGMFNTLTVSLLERTREVGFMKALGMKSHEIRDLFLTESLLMGIFGGFFGLLLGHLAGLMINLFLSVISWSQGGDYIDVTHIPFSLFVVVLALSLIVGIFTGFYPARRATRISALNALRYE